ncbi:hypothetical protein FHR84_003565 [Actinopolyspora biskrensis]|uniref:Secreted protein n=1 Tax=Actinopolyspora biskrensis TaxID=1470178 RepID=A0A852Z9J4_9ACTN|nr:hypothetical protein [Actinopolyspora biskrensis]NYH80216.1 hypothetical protein [Actinopolyspora biskrensis]
MRKVKLISVLSVCVASFFGMNFPAQAAESSGVDSEKPTVKQNLSDCNVPSAGWRHCTEVTGQGDYVNTVRAMQSFSPCESSYGHFQVYIVYGNQWQWEWSGPDFNTKTDCWGNFGGIEEHSRWLEVNGSYPNAHVCSKFWIREGEGYVEASPSADPCVQMNP